ncbi:MAG: septum formation protein Maf [Bdellovibrionales bacterium]|nr:septum formation protein Maf [Bdellovibrionales bacterium]
MSRTMTKLVLASSSPFRKQLLLDAGYSPVCISPEVDEDAVKGEGLSPSQLADKLAEMKARAVWQGLSSSSEKAVKHIVIGSDQVACLDDEIFSKPGSEEKATETLQRLAGKTHQLITSVCVISPGSVGAFQNVTKLTMRQLREDQIRSYVAADQPLNCAGSYMLEKGGIKLFEKIESEDFTAIQGLPMIALTTMLIEISPEICF